MPNITIGELRKLLLELAEFIDIAAVCHLDSDDMELAREYASRAREVEAELRMVEAKATIEHPDIVVEARYV